MIPAHAWIIAALLPLGPAALAAQQSTAAALAKTVDAHYNHLYSLQCRYTERYRGLGMDRSETGTLTLQKPGRMRWAYDSPAGKLFLLDGTSAVSYTPGDPQATRYPEKQLDDLRSPLRFLLGHTELAKELTGLSLTLAAPGRFLLYGTPKGMQQRIRQISLTVDQAGVIQAMSIDEIDGSQTTFTFADIKEDLPTSPAEFTFNPPQGVSVVNGSPPI